MRRSSRFSQLYCSTVRRNARRAGCSALSASRHCSVLPSRRAKGHACLKIPAAVRLYPQAGALIKSFMFTGYQISLLRVARRPLALIAGRLCRRVGHCGRRWISRVHGFFLASSARFHREREALRLLGIGRSMTWAGCGEDSYIDAPPRAVSAAVERSHRQSVLTVRGNRTAITAMSALERSLDEIIGSKREGNQRRERSRDTRPRSSRGAGPYDRRQTDDGRWSPDRTGGRGEGRGDRRRDRTEQTARLRVSNVHYDLSEQDIRELFQQVGQVTQCRMHYDRAGRSLGTVNVEFRHADDARAAARRFE